MTKHKMIQRWKYYKEGKVPRKSCPRCGEGTWLARHKDRLSCGKCNYMETEKK